MLIRTEKSTNENGEKIKKEYYGYIDENGNEVITGTRKMPDVEYTGEPVQSEPTDIEIMQADIAYLKMKKG